MLRIAGIWADADIFCGHSWVAMGCFRLKKLIFLQNFFVLLKIFLFKFFHGQCRALQLVFMWHHLSLF